MFVNWEIQQINAVGSLQTDQQVLGSFSAKSQKSFSKHRQTYSKNYIDTDKIFSVFTIFGMVIVSTAG